MLKEKNNGDAEETGFLQKTRFLVGQQSCKKPGFWQTEAISQTQESKETTASLDIPGNFRQ